MKVDIHDFTDSIEMSTSQSLTGLEDDDETETAVQSSSTEVDSNSNKVHKNKQPLTPPSKKSKISHSIEKFDAGNELEDTFTALICL